MASREWVIWGTIINHVMVANRVGIMHSADWLGPEEEVVGSYIMS